MKLTIQQINSNHKLMKPADAEELASKLSLDDCETDYRAVHDPKGTGLSYVAIFEDNQMIMAI